MGYVHKFSDGDASKTELLGGKGAHLCEMASMGLPVPHGVIISTDACIKYQSLSHTDRMVFVQGLVNEVMTHFVTEASDTFPLVSVRSGAKISMPGMMDTLLNIGLTKDTLPTWSAKLGNRLALDCYRRGLQIFGTTVHGLPYALFDKCMVSVKKCKFGQSKRPKSDADLSFVHLKKLVEKYEAVFTKQGHPVPGSVVGQLCAAVHVVFMSWNSERAVLYRKLNGIPDTGGTAVVVQRMVFGNMNSNSCSGVVFTRNPQTGENEIYGEYLPNAQGEDVVSGVRTPLPISAIVKWNPGVAAELSAVADKLEAHYGDMQDVEFTVENGALHILQTRRAKRSARAAFKVAYDFHEELGVSKQDTLKKVTGAQYVALTTKSVDLKASDPPSFVGLAASNGVVSGVCVLTKEAAIASPVPCILVTKETNPEDYPGMVAAVGVLTSTGGATSHAAVVARGMDKACVVGCAGLFAEGSPLVLASGQMITLDGSTGNVWVGKKVVVQEPVLEPHVHEMIGWAMEGCSGYQIVLTPHDAVGVKRAYVPFVELAAGNVEPLFRALENAESVFVSGISRIWEQDKWFLNALGGAGGLESPSTDHVAPYLYLLEGVADKCVQLAGNTPPSMAHAFDSWPKVQTVNTVAGLFKMDGYAAVSGDTLSVLENEGVNFDEVVLLLVAAGKKVQAVPTPVSKMGILFEAFGK